MTPGNVFAINGVAVEVPSSWAYNDLDCGIPQTSTVVINVSTFSECRTEVPEKVESLWLFEEPAASVAGLRRTIIEDAEAYISDAECQIPEQISADDPVKVCTQTLYFPEHEVQVQAVSSEGGRSVTSLLESVNLMVPGIAVEPYVGLESRPQAYVEMIRESGLRPETPEPVEVRVIESVYPPPGTVLPPNAIVRIRGQPKDP